MRYIIGIDLGTTNSAVAFVDTQKGHLPVELLGIPQFVAEGQTEIRSTLPSFYYKDDQKDYVGQWAKIQGARVPTRLVQSAKSWLCNTAAERRDRILPVEAASITERISPVEASAKYLLHLKESWNRTLAKGDPILLFEEQEVVLTVPASFDEVARTLTVEAARLAGLLHITLLEEPQAAFYSWISQHESEWETQFVAGQNILVCDVGGGTTDFSLIEVHVKEGKLSFQRMAVGDHLLLGGDNMDVTLAHALEKKLERTLEGTQWLQLLAEARAAKEELLTDPTKNYPITLQGSGSSVVAGSLSTILEAEEVQKILVDGFFGSYSFQDALNLKKSRGLRTMGLPYEDDPSITKHLAHFLKQSKVEEGIDYILFNGGTLKPQLFQNALLQSLIKWFPQRSPKVLPTVSLDLAVARGAAYYGKVRRGLGVAIQGGIPRTYYLEVDVKGEEGRMIRKALTLLPRGSEEGYTYQPKLSFSLRSNTPVAFHLLTSHVRLHDQAGQIVAIDELEMQRLPSIQTILRYGTKSLENEQNIPVQISIELTAVGTVDLWLHSQKTSHQWKLEFQWRSATGQDPSLKSHPQDETYSSGYLDQAKQTISDFYNGLIKPAKIIEKLEQDLHLKKNEWPSSILRGLSDALLLGASKRKLSTEHETRFWNLAGFCLRPGYGYPLDDFRIKELWKIILADLKSFKNQEAKMASWICFRRISGGLNKGQQTQIATELLTNLLDKRTGKFEAIRKSDHYAYSEKIRALASLERLEIPLKIKLAQALLLNLTLTEGETCDYWSLARLGARHLIYGSAGQVVPREQCAQWVETLLTLSPTHEEEYLFTLTQLARKTDQRELNLPDPLITKTLQKYAQLENDLLNQKELSSQQQEHLFGDQLPTGLVLHE